MSFENTVKKTAGTVRQEETSVTAVVRETYPRLLQFLPLIVLVSVTSITLLLWWNDLQSQRRSRWREFQTHTAVTAGQMAIRLEDHYRMHLRALERFRLMWPIEWRNKEDMFRREASVLCQLYPGFRAVSFVDANGVLRWVEQQDLSHDAEGKDFKRFPARWAELHAPPADGSAVMSAVDEMIYNGRGFLLSLPLKMENRFEGYLQAAFRLPQFVDECLIDRAGEQFHIELSESGQKQSFYNFGHVTPEEAADAPPSVQRRVNVGDHVWEMRVQPAASYFTMNRSWGESMLLSVGLALSMILSIAVWILQQRNRRLAQQHERLQESDAALRENVRSLRLLNEISGVLSRSLELRTLVDQTLDKLHKGLGGDITAFYRLNPESQSLELDAQRGVPEEMMRELRVQGLGSRFAGRAAQTGEMIVVDDITTDPRNTKMRSLRLSLRFSVYMPVKHGDKIMGLLVVAFRSERKLAPADLELLKLIAEAMGVAVSNALLFAEVRASHEFFQSLLDGATDAVFVEGNDYRLTKVNPRACQLLGYKREELVGQPSTILYTREDQQHLLPRTRPQLKEDREVLFQANYQTKDGIAVPVEVSARVVQVGGQELVLTFARDLTVRRRLEQELFQAHTMESLGTLAGGIAHDFNNLLSGILGFGTLALTTMRPEDPHYRELLQIVSAGERAAALVQRLLTLGRKVPPKPRPTNLNEVVDQVAYLLRHSLANSTEVRIDKQAHLPSANVDPLQWEQVLMNLCLNARDAIAHAARPGVLTIQTSVEEIRRSMPRMVGAPPPGRYVTLQVRDTGCGMDAATRQRLFEPFFTTKGEGQGTGLGLMMVFSIVKTHQGFIEVDSEMGQGSTFRIRLPAVDAPAVPIITPSNEAPRGDETLLLVDDDLSVLDLTRLMLERHGYTVLTARDAMEGLDCYRKNAEQIALVITDLIMPRVSGVELIGQLRDLKPKLKIIVSTGYSAEAAAVTRAGQQPNAVIQKPFHMSELARLVRKTLDNGQEQSEAEET